MVQMWFCWPDLTYTVVKLQRSIHMYIEAEFMRNKYHLFYGIHLQINVFSVKCAVERSDQINSSETKKSHVVFLILFDYRNDHAF